MLCIESHRAEAPTLARCAAGDARAAARQVVPRLQLCRVPQAAAEHQEPPYDSWQRGGSCRRK
eukprot:1367648-Prymnesium_polylepis.2